MAKHDLLLPWVLLVACGLLSSAASGARNRFYSTGETRKKVESAVPTITVRGLQTNVLLPGVPTVEDLCDEDECGPQKQECDYEECGCFHFEEGRLHYCIPRINTKDGLKSASVTSSESGYDTSEGSSITLPEYIGSSSDNYDDSSDDLRSRSSEDQSSDHDSLESNSDSSDGTERMDTSLGDDNSDSSSSSGYKMVTSDEDNVFLQDLLNYVDPSDDDLSYNSASVRGSQQGDSETPRYIMGTIQENPSSSLDDSSSLLSSSDTSSDEDPHHDFTVNLSDYSSATPLERMGSLSEYLETDMMDTIAEESSSSSENSSSSSDTSSDEDANHAVPEELSNVLNTPHDTSDVRMDTLTGDDDSSIHSDYDTIHTSLGDNAQSEFEDDVSYVSEGGSIRNGLLSDYSATPMERMGTLTDYSEGERMPTIAEEQSLPEEDSSSSEESSSSSSSAAAADEDEDAYHTFSEELSSISDTSDNDRMDTTSDNEE